MDFVLFFLLAIFILIAFLRTNHVGNLISHALVWFVLIDLYMLWRYATIAGQQVEISFLLFFDNVSASAFYNSLKWLLILTGLVFFVRILYDSSDRD